MRKLLLLSATILISSSLLAQKGNSKQQKSREDVLGTGSTTGQPSTTTKGKDQQESGTQRAGRSTDPVWEGTGDGGNGKGKGGNKGKGGAEGKYSKNQPAKVRAAFARDYPNATGVTWSKYRGDWTATFNNGLTRSTAVYHANGERRDTRTAIPSSQVPRSVVDEILKRRPGSRINEAVRIQAPKVSDIFRVKTTQNGTTQYLFYNASGKQVTYDY